MFQSVVCDLNCRRFDKSGSAQVQRRIGPFHPVSERGASATHWLWALFIPYQREGPQLLTGIGPFHPVSERGASANHSATHLALGAALALRYNLERSRLRASASADLLPCFLVFSLRNAM